MGRLKKKLKFTITHFLCLSLFFVLFFPFHSFAANLYVGDCYRGPGYTTIQNAINAASNGDTIYVCDGTYNENLSISNKSLSIIGYSNDPSRVIVQNSGSNNDTIKISTYVNSLTFSNITFKNTSSKYVMNFSAKPNSVIIKNSRIEGNGSDTLYFDKGIGSLSISNTSISNKSSRGIQINGSSDNGILIDNVSIDAKNTAFWVTGTISNGFTIKNSSIESQDSEGIDFNIVSDIFYIDNVTVKSYKSSILVRNVINKGFTLKNSNLFSTKDKAIYFVKPVSNDINVDSNKLEGDLGFWIDGNVNNDLIITNTSIKANRDVALKITNTANGSIKISNSNIIATSNHAVQLYTINKNLEILNTKIESGSGKKGLEVFNDINGFLKIENSEIYAGESALIINKTISGNATIKSSNIISDTFKGAVFSGDISGGLNIDNSSFIASSTALALQSAKSFNPVITNSYFESKVDTAVDANLSQWTSFNAQNNCFKTSGNNNNNVGLNLQITNSSDVNINNNCFYAPSITQLANSNREGYNWRSNYWDKFTGNIYNYNKIKDDSPLMTCPNICLARAIPKPIADFHFDECSWDNDDSTFEVKDSSGNLINGSSVNGANTESSDTSGGGINRVGKFDGSKKTTIQIPANQKLQIGGSLTYMAWIKHDPANKSLSNIFTNGGWGNALRMQNNNKALFELQINGDQQLYSKKSIDDFNWHHIAGVYDSNKNEMRIYIDGALDNSMSVNGTLTVYTGNNYIGSENGIAYYYTGYIDEVKIFNNALDSKVISAIYNYEKSGKNWDGTDRVKVNCLQLNQCFFDDFNRNSLGSKWTIIKNENFTPIIEDNKLLLTKKITNVASGVTLAGKFPSQDNYIEIEFEHNAYGNNGNGADGVTIALADAAVVDRLLSDNISDIAGAYGGSLGYAQRSGLHGFKGGWLGIGVDEYGNFANDKEGRGKNCTTTHPPQDKVKDSITIRGRGDNDTGYCFIANSGQLNPGVDNSTAKNYKYKISIDTRNNKTFIKVDRDILDGNGYQTIINWYDATQNATPPDNFKLSITGSTGSVTNIHSIDDLKISALSCGDLGQEIGYKYLLIDAPPTALTCQPADVTITACINDDCSQKYSSGVSGIQLSATNGANWTTNPVSIPNGSYSVNTGLYKQTPGQTTLSITSANPLPSNTPIYKCSWDPNCVVTFYDSGFVFDIPDNYSCKPQNDITIKAVRKDDTTKACVPSFQNKTIPVDFSFNYVNPNTNPHNTKPKINDTDLNATIDLSFNNNGEASFKFEYDDAGQISVTASYDNGSVKAVGSDSATFKPFGFYVYTATSNGEAENGANSTVFKKAGEEFNLSAKAVCWESDTDTDLSNNRLTQNYQKNNATVSHTLVSPVGGNNGTISVTSLNFTNGVASVDNQKFSEVGIIKFTVTDNDYLGTGPITGTSANIGRFIPDHFELTESFIEKYTSDFVYMGNPFELKYTIQAKNTDNNTTLNYTGEFAKGIVDLFAENNYDGNNLINRFTPALSSSWGNGSYSFFDNVTFTKDPANLKSLENFRLGINVTDPDGPILINRDMKPGAASCTSDCQYKIIDNSTRILNAILDIQNAYGPANYLLNVPAYILYYDKNGKLTINTADNKTTFTISNITLSNWTQNLKQGDTDVVDLIKKSNGYFEIKLKAPGTNKNGSVTLNLSGLDFLKDTVLNNLTQGIATFGIFGNQQKRLYWKEVPAK